MGLLLWTKRDVVGETLSNDAPKIIFRKCWNFEV